MGESYPRAWSYIAPDATAIVGIEWQQLHQSFLADALAVELLGERPAGLSGSRLPARPPGRFCSLAGPDLLRVASGTFPAATVAAQATSLGMRSADYDGVRMWIAPGTRGRSVAQVNDTLLLIGFRDTLEATPSIWSLLTAERHSSPLLARGAHPGGDLRPMDNRDGAARSAGDRVPARWIWKAAISTAASASAAA